MLMLLGEEQNEYDRALLFQQAAHAGQVRRYTGEPYWNHPVRVAGHVAQVPGREIADIQAALLHDVLEDTTVSPGTVRDYFGSKVFYYVELLSDMEPGNRATRRLATLERLRTAPAAVQTIKLADVLDNATSIAQHDPQFARVYLTEKADLLAVLTKADRELHKVVWNVVLTELHALRSRFPVRSPSIVAGV